MNISSMKNIVVLQNLPSNIVEEAIVVLKENQKLKKVELLDSEKEKNRKEPKGAKDKSAKIEGTESKEKSKDYIVKEAQMLISEYISKIENKDKDKRDSVSFKNLKKKYQKLKIINIALGIALVLSFFFSL